MTSTATRPALDEALAVLRHGVDLLLAADVGLVADESLLEAVRHFEVQRRRLAAADARLIAEVDARGLAAERGARDTRTLLTLLLRVDPAEADARTRASRDVVGRRTLSGDRIEAALPHAAAALREGVLHPRHVAIIAKTIDALPVDVQAVRDREIEQQLVAEAARFAPYQVAKLAERVCYLYDQDGVLADDSHRQRRRELTYRRAADGSLTGQFRLDPTTAEAFETVLDAQLANVSGQQRDGRTPAQLRHDALRDSLLMLIRARQLPDAGGVSTTIVVTMTAGQLATLVAAGRGSAADGSTPGTVDIALGRAFDAPVEPLAGATGPPAPGNAAAGTASRPPQDGRLLGPPGERLAVTSHGAFLTLNEVAPLLGDAQLFPVVLSGLGSVKRIEAYGDKHRIFTANQRLALAARDRGCSFPGCTSTPTFCEAHHVREHADGGPTSVANGTLVCPYHHRSFAELGYTCTMLDGVPHWIAPAWIDPTRTPTRNTAHDPQRTF